MTDPERVFQDQLYAALQYAAEDPDQSGLDCLVETFEHSGVMTGNAGLVISLEDGSEYQLRITQSKRADGVAREEFGR